MPRVQALHPFVAPANNEGGDNNCAGYSPQPPREPDQAGLRDLKSEASQARQSKSRPNGAAYDDAANKTEHRLRPIKRMTSLSKLPYQARSRQSLDGIAYGNPDARG